MKITKFKIICSIIIIIVIGICIYAITFMNKGKQKVDTQYLNSVLVKSSELTAAKLTINGITDYKDSGIAFINKSNFTMVYKATVRAGINVNDVKIESNDTDTIYITIPKAQIQDVKVDPKSIKYYDEKIALFNTNEKEDSNAAIIEAEKQAKIEAEKTGILELANQQSAVLIKGILTNAIPNGYKIEIK